MTQNQKRAKRPKRVGPLDYVTSRARLEKFQETLIELRKYFTLEEIADFTWRKKKNVARISHTLKGRHLGVRPVVRIAEQDFQDIMQAHEFLMRFVGYRHEVRLKVLEVQRRFADLNASMMELTDLVHSASRRRKR